MTEFAANPNVPALIALVFVQVLFVTLVYGPIAAYLVEAFPAKVRYTSMSVPTTSATASSVGCCQ